MDALTENPAVPSAISTPSLSTAPSSEQPVSSSRPVQNDNENGSLHYPEGVSPFLSPPSVATADTLALMFLRRDNIQPIYLSNNPNAIEHTRFGSFPHSALIGRPWGSQVLSSHVKGTTSFTKRSRQVRLQVQALAGAKRKRDGNRNEGRGEDENGDQEGGNGDDNQVQLNGGTSSESNLEITQSNSGFVYLLPPTPELWTQSLPHRTQVVYTPDYSYVLSRLRVRPGSRLIEAGAGSGSFTHAAVRAVFSGYPGSQSDDSKPKKQGRVFSYEYHEPRAQQLQTELIAHGMEKLVTLTHRDVYQEGFCFKSDASSNIDKSGPEQPYADAIFLDLPNPWLALPHLSRTASPSALNPKRAVHICTFSPCIEQVTKTVETMRDLGFLDISMVEIMHKNLEVRRRKFGSTGFAVANGPSDNSPQTVDEAVNRLLRLKHEREHAHRVHTVQQQKDKNKDKSKGANKSDGEDEEEGEEEEEEEQKGEAKGSTSGTSSFPAPSASSVRKGDRNKNPKGASSGGASKPWLEGQVVHRTEQELKTHTSYLVFAVIPRAWTAEDEAKAAKRWAKKSAGSASGRGRAAAGAGGVVSEDAEPAQERSELATVKANENGQEEGQNTNTAHMEIEDGDEEL